MLRFTTPFLSAVAITLTLNSVVAQEPSVSKQLKERFAQLDRNKDGALTPDEIDAAAPFNKLDTDQDGRITLKEAGLFLKGLKQTAQPEPASELIEKYRATIPARNPLRQRIADRSFPSVFMAWSPATNLPDKDPLQVMARHDLVFVGATSFGLRWNRRPSGLADGFDPKGIPRARAVRAKLQQLNPNLVLLAEIRYRDANRSFLPADHPWWKRNSDGNRADGWEEGGFKLLDFSNPDYRAHVAQRAKATLDTGVFDGVMIDWWNDDKDRIELAKEIRHAIGKDAVLLANANDRTTPATAPYINGYFMECYRSKTREDWDRIAKTLRFAETNLREPRLNCLEVWYAQSRQDLNRMRATTCLALTHSNGYCLFSDPNPLPTPDHLHNWYPFWERKLGKPVAEGVINTDGSARREFTNGTAVYNPMGNQPLVVKFPNSRRSLATGKSGKQHTVPPLDGDIFLKRP